MWVLNMNVAVVLPCLQGLRGNSIHRHSDKGSESVEGRSTDYVEGSQQLVSAWLSCEMLMSSYTILYKSFSPVLRK